MSDDSKWMIATRPGTLASGKFVKAGEIFQLGPDDVYSDKWMQPHEPPADITDPPSEEEVKEEQRKAVKEHEEQDRARRGKFTIPEIPLSAEAQKERDERAREKRRETIEKAQKEHPIPGTPEAKEAGKDNEKTADAVVAKPAVPVAPKAKT